MTHTLAQALFAVSFALVWAFIGSMILGDSLHLARRNRIDNAHEMPPRRGRRTSRVASDQKISA